MRDQDEHSRLDFIGLVAFQLQAFDLGFGIHHLLADIEWLGGFLLELGEGESGERRIRSELQPRGQELFAPERHFFGFGISHWLGLFECRGRRCD